MGIKCHSGIILYKFIQTFFFNLKIYSSPSLLGTLLGRVPGTFGGKAPNEAD